MYMQGIHIHFPVSAHVAMLSPCEIYYKDKCKTLKTAACWASESFFLIEINRDLSWKTASVNILNFQTTAKSTWGKWDYSRLGVHKIQCQRQLIKGMKDLWKTHLSAPCVNVISPVDHILHFLFLHYYRHMLKTSALTRKTAVIENIWTEIAVVTK